MEHNQDEPYFIDMIEDHPIKDFKNQLEQYLSKLLFVPPDTPFAKHSHNYYTYFIHCFAQHIESIQVLYRHSNTHEFQIDTYLRTKEKLFQALDNLIFTAQYEHDTK